MRILVVGAAGQVGGSVAAWAHGRGDEVVGSYRTRPPTLAGVRPIPLDVTDPGAVARTIEATRPELVVDTAALHNVDACERDPAGAHRVNGEAAATLAHHAHAAGARFVYVSTDFVFDGTGRPPYHEDDPPHPLSVYGESKLAGEQAVLTAHPEALVVRPSVIYSWVPPSRTSATSSSGKPVNFGAWMAREARAGRPMRIVEDQIASPTYSEDLAEAILRLVDGGHTGRFHTAGATAVSRYEFARRLLDALGLPTTLLTPIRTSELRQVARRPPNSSLDSALLTARTGHRMLDLDRALDRFAEHVRTDPGVPP